MPQGAAIPVSKGEVERAARMYDSVKKAAARLRVSEKRFKALCREHNVENPCERERRIRRERSSRARLAAV